MASSLLRTGFVRGSMMQGNGCYQHRCLNNTLEVAVDGIWKPCPEAGGPLQFPGFNGELICPAYHELCSVAPMPGNGQCPDSCNFNGDCAEGRCHCFLGFHGHDCNKRSWGRTHEVREFVKNDGLQPYQSFLTRIDIMKIIIVNNILKEVFTCAKDWGLEALMKELDCVRIIFHVSKDLDGKVLEKKTDDMLTKLGKKQISPIDAIADNQLFKERVF